MQAKIERTATGDSIVVPALRGTSEIEDQMKRTLLKINEKRGGDVSKRTEVIVDHIHRPVPKILVAFNEVYIPSASNQLIILV